MTKLGPNLWDDPNFVSGTIEPKFAGFDIGSPAHPFRNMYLEGSVVGAGELINNDTWLQWESSGGVDTDVLRLNAANEVELNAATGEAINLQIDKVTKWSVNSAGALVQSSTGSDIVFGVSPGVLRQTGTASRLFIEAGGTSSTADGATIIMNGNTAGGGNNGKISVNAGDVAAATVTINAANATGFIAFLCNTAESFRVDATQSVLLAQGKLIKHTTGGAAATAGTFVCNGATNVVITTSQADATMLLDIGLSVVGGTVGQVPRVTTITNGVSFTVAGTASDTSTYNWAIMKRV